MPFTNKVTLGTYISDGLRTGPVLPGQVYSQNYTTEGPNSVTPTGDTKVRNYGRYGNSILLSPDNTYSIVPFNGANGVPNIFALQTGSIAAGTFFPLSAGTANNNPASQLVNSPTTKQNYIQFDYPRVPGVIVTYTGGTTPAPSLENVRIVFKGTDGYGFPIAHQYTLTDTANGGGIMYPLTYNSPVNNDIVADSGTWACNVKAFDTITSVQILDELPEDYTLLGVATNMFGLPYKCKGPTDVVSFSWAGQNLKDLNGTIELTQDETKPAFWTEPIYCPGVGNFYATPSGFQNISGVSLTTYFSQGDGADIDTYQTPLLQFCLTNNGDASPATYFSTANSDIDNITYIPYIALPVVGYYVTGTTFANENNQVNWTLANGGYNLIQYADESTPSLTSGDPRGVIRLPCTQDYESTWSSTLYPQPDGYQNRLIFKQYVYGADAYQDQLSASNYLIGTTEDPTTAQTETISPLNLTDLYGVPPYSGT